MIAIAAGGTGGHIFPAIAVAQALTKKGQPVVFIGNKGGMEEKVVQERGIPFYGIHSAGLVGKTTWGKFKGVFQMGLGLKESLEVLRKKGVKLVLGMGSYTSVPVAVAAHILGIDLIIHEQNVIPGKANQFLSRWAKLACISFEGSKEYLRGKCILTGNPIREEIIKAALLKGREHKEKKFTIFILGGSQGARVINEAFCEAWAFLKKFKNELYFIHQTGKLDYNRIKEFYSQERIPGEVHSFIKDVGDVYLKAKLVVARAGASTIAEITAMGLPAILIPFPGAVGHQFYNAQVLERAGAAWVIPQSRLSGRLLAEQIRELYCHTDLLETMSLNASKLGKPNAAQEIMKIVEESML